MSKFSSFSKCVTGLLLMSNLAFAESPSSVGGRLGMTGGAPTVGFTGEFEVSTHSAAGLSFDQMAVSEEVSFGELSLSQSSVSAFGKYRFNPTAETWVGFVMAGVSLHRWSMEFNNTSGDFNALIVDDMDLGSGTGMGIDLGGGTQIKINPLLSANIGIIVREGSLADAGLLHAGLDYRL
jgi:hypothetical protein